MRIGVIVAMDKEWTQIKSLLNHCHTESHNNKSFVIGTIGENEIITMQCGIGKVNSAIGTVEMINRYSPDLVVSTGVAGGANSAVNVGDVVVGSTYAYHDAYCGSECERGQLQGLPPYFSASDVLINKALHTDHNQKIHSGLIVSGDWFVDSRDKMLSIVSDFPEAMAVDMESCSIAQTCYIYNVSFIAFRIISDMPLKENNTAQYFDFWSSIADSSFNVTKSFLDRL